MWDFRGDSDGKASDYNAGDPGSIPGSGRSPGEGNGNPLQYSCLENPMDGEACWATVQGVAKSRTRLSDFTLRGCDSLGTRRHIAGSKMVSSDSFSPGILIRVYYQLMLGWSV